MPMQIFLTLDYELFSGENPGSVYNSIILPTQKLLEVGDRYDAKFVFFVDSGYLDRLNHYKDQYQLLADDYEMIVTQLKMLDTNGHDIQLHIHPHWEDCTHDGQKWYMDTSRFRIHSFEKDEIDDIVYRYKKVLTDIVGDKVFAYRAGGWCLQPFDKLKDALKNHNILLDSTVYEDGFNSSATHFYDFKNAPLKSFWRFEDDPVVEASDGSFVEVPISTYAVSPLFFWKFAYHKKFAKNSHKTYGDGVSAGGSSNSSIFKMLSSKTRSIVSMDGYRASLLKKALKESQKRDPEGNFVVIGHPKAVTPYSLDMLDGFLNFKAGEHRVMTFTEFQDKSHLVDIQ